MRATAFGAIIYHVREWFRPRGCVDSLRKEKGKRDVCLSVLLKYFTSNVLVIIIYILCGSKIFIFVNLLSLLSLLRIQIQ